MGSKQRKGIIKGSLNVTIVENLAIYLNTAPQKLGMKVTKAMPHKIPSPRSNTPGTSVSESRTSQAENSEN